MDFVTRREIILNSNFCARSVCTNNFILVCIKYFKSFYVINNFEKMYHAWYEFGPSYPDLSVDLVPGNVRGERCERELCKMMFCFV